LSLGEPKFFEGLTVIPLLHLAAFPRAPEEAGSGEEPLDRTSPQRQYGE